MKSRITPKGLIGTGALSLMVVLTVLCLAAFGVLSLTAAASDQSMSKKNAAFIQDWYEADGRAAQRLSAIYQSLQEAALETADEASFFTFLPEILSEEYDSESRRIIFQEPVNRSLVLTVELDALYQEPYYRIISWKTEVTADPSQEEQPTTLWDGGFPNS